MKIEEIQEAWAKESKPNHLDLGMESLSTSSIRDKYAKWLGRERLILLKREQEFKRLKLEKYEFYTQGPNEETQKKGWKLPAIGKVLVKDAQMYIDADPDVIKHTLAIGVQKEKIAYLEGIVDSLKWRHNQIKNYIDYVKFLQGN